MNGKVWIGISNLICSTLWLFVAFSAMSGWSFAGAIFVSILFAIAAGLNFWTASL